MVFAESAKQAICLFFPHRQTTNSDRKRAAYYVDRPVFDWGAVTIELNPVLSLHLLLAPEIPGNGLLQRSKSGRFKLEKSGS